MIFKLCAQYIKFNMYSFLSDLWVLWSHGCCICRSFCCVLGIRVSDDGNWESNIQTRQKEIISKLLYIHWKRIYITLIHINTSLNHKTLSTCKNMYISWNVYLIVFTDVYTWIVWFFMKTSFRWQQIHIDLWKI